MKQTKTNKLGKLAMAGIIAGTAVIAGFAGATLFPRTITEEVVVTETVTEFVDVPVNITEYVEVPVNVTEYVEVDNENLPIVLEEIYNNDGKVNYLLDDLDDDELDLIVDRIAFVNDIKAMAVAEVKAELFDELDGEIVDGVKLDEDDMERLRLDDDLDELIVKEIDFEDKDAVIEVTGSFEQEDIKYDYVVEVEFKDGEIEDFDVKSVTVV